MRLLKDLPPRLSATITALRVLPKREVLPVHAAHALLHDHSTVRPGGPFERGDKVRVSASGLASFNRRGEVLEACGRNVKVLLESGLKADFTPWELTKVVSL